MPDHHATRAIHTAADAPLGLKRWATGALTAGYRLAFTTSAGLLLAALLVGVLVLRRDPAAAPAPARSAAA